MKAKIKRLVSLLIAVTLVLGMVPAAGKPVTQAAQLSVSKITGDGQVTYASMAEAVADYTADDFAQGNYIRANADTSVALQGGSYYIDCAGYTMQITGSGKLAAMDSSNDDFYGAGQWTVAAEVELVRDHQSPVKGTRYVVLTEDGVTDAHALTMELSDVSLNIKEAGLYYSAQYQCDNILAGRISAYGILASTQDMPGAQLGSGDARTELHSFVPDGDHRVVSQSSTVYGILKESRTAEENARHGQAKIYANAYIELDTDGDGQPEILVADRENVGKKAGNAWSLYDVLKYVDDNWLDFGGQHAAVNSFYAQWENRGLSQYSFTNIDRHELSLDSSGRGYCPACQETVTWTAYTGAADITVANAHAHYYLTGNVNYPESLTTNMMKINDGGKVCFHFNGYTLTTHGRFWLNANDESPMLNLMTEKGGIVYTGTSAASACIQHWRGAVNVYGGTYSVSAGNTKPILDISRVATIKDAVINGEVLAASLTSKVTLEGAAIVQKLTLADEREGTNCGVIIAKDWSGAANLSVTDTMWDTDGGLKEANGSATGSFAGTLTLTDGETLHYGTGRLFVKGRELTLDSSSMGYCQVCDQRVSWTRFDGTQNYTDISDHRHFYLASDVTYDRDAVSVNMLTISAGGTVCFHFNGYTLTTGGRFWLGSDESDSNTLNLITKTGGVVYTVRNDIPGCVQNNNGALNVYGGTYTAAVGETKPFVNANRSVTLEDATVNGHIILANKYGQVKLKGASSVTGGIDLSAGKLTVDSSFSGAATVMAAEKLLENGGIKAANGVANGSFTGKLKLSTGESLVCYSGRLVNMEKVQTDVAKPLTWDDINAIPIANNNMTEAELRQICVDFMKLMLSIPWTPSINTVHQGRGSATKQLYSGSVYGGIPYVPGAMGNIYSMMEYYNEENGVLDLSGGMDTIRQFANQCSGSAFWAWNRVCNSAKFTNTADMTEKNGCIPVGSFTRPANLSDYIQDNVSTKDICYSNDSQVMYAAYAKLKAADGVVTVCDQNNHVMMVTGVHVKKNWFNTGIVAAESYITYVDQDGVYYSENQSNGVSYERVGGYDAKITFQQLYSQGYIPFTFAELNKSTPVVKSETTMSYSGQSITLDQLNGASVRSNYSMSDVTVVVKDQTGKQVYRKMTPVHNYIGIQLHHHYMYNVISMKDLVAFADGRHTLEVSVRIGTGEKPVVYSGTLMR